MRMTYAPAPALALLAMAMCCIVPATSLAPHPFRRMSARPLPLQEHLRGHLHTSSSSVAARDAASAAPAPRWVEQPLDHFDSVDTRTWKQRYFANDEWFVKRNNVNNARNKKVADAAAAAPVVFLCMGGEGPALAPSVVVTGGVHCALMVDIAKRRGALVVALEHRFYGGAGLRVDALELSKCLLVW